MLCLPKFDGRFASPLVRVDEVDGVQLVAAVVALVAARLEIAADRALALDVAVGQGASSRGVEGTHLLFLQQVAALVQLQEQLLRHAIVVGGGRAREDVVRHAQPHEVLDDDGVVLVDELARRDALFVRLVRDRRAVLVRAAGHQHAGAAQPPVAREDVAGHGKADHVADVSRPVGVRPGRRDEDRFRFRHLR